MVEYNRYTQVYNQDNLYPDRDTARDVSKLIYFCGNDKTTRLHKGQFNNK